jgi:hypothetical protein
MGNCGHLCCLFHCEVGLFLSIFQISVHLHVYSFSEILHESCYSFPYFSLFSDFREFTLHMTSKKSKSFCPYIVLFLLLFICLWNICLNYLLHSENSFKSSINGLLEKHIPLYIIFVITVFKLLIFL